VLILTQDECTVCAERSIGSEIVLAHPMELVSDVGHVELESVFDKEMPVMSKNVPNLSRYKRIRKIATLNFT
jgi:hypothetical protein